MPRTSPIMSKSTVFKDGSSVSTSLFDPEDDIEKHYFERVFLHVKTSDPALGDKLLRLEYEEAVELKRQLASFGL